MILACAHNTLWNATQAFIITHRAWRVTKLTYVTYPTPQSIVTTYAVIAEAPVMSDRTTLHSLI